MKFNRAELWKILKPWIDFDEGETGDCPELGEILGKVVEHEKGFEEELREKRRELQKTIHRKYIEGRIFQIKAILGDKTKENEEQ